MPPKLKRKKQNKKTHNYMKCHYTIFFIYKINDSLQYTSTKLVVTCSSGEDVHILDSTCVSCAPFFYCTLLWESEWRRGHTKTTAPKVNWRIPCTFIVACDQLCWLFLFQFQMCQGLLTDAAMLFSHHISWS